MKRTIFITIGSIVLLLIFSVWIYLLLFGAPKEVNEAFSNLGFGTFTPIETSPEPLEQTAQLNLNSGLLAQLTTRPVAGFDFLITGSSTEKLRYAERGTGHVFEIDLTTGVETRVSAKTHLAVTAAYFSPDGKAVVLMSESESGLTAKLEELGDRERSHSLPENSNNFSFEDNEKLRYLLKTNEGSIGYEYDLNEMTVDEIFFLPLSDINVLWGDTQTLVYNHPAPYLRGGLYKIQGGVLDRIGSTNFSLSAEMAKGNGNYIYTAANLNDRGQLDSVIISASSTEVLPIVAIPEKCTFTNDGATAWCGSNSLPWGREDQSNWYKGLVSYADILWQIEASTGKTTLLDNLTGTSGREVDVTDLKVDVTSKFLLFKNKKDDSLWLRRLEG